ncbi:MAG: hypothetical protein ACPLQP_05610 [Moorellaceae bacterium]
MYLREAVGAFRRSRDPELLRQILKEHGQKGFSIACRAAGISRGAGRRLIHTYDDSGAISQMAAKSCGLKTSSIWRG